jgi:hypothetical protein
MAFVEPIRIERLRDLQAALRQASEGSQKKLRVVFNDAAATVAGGASRRVARGPSGKARASIRPKSEQRVARVVGGGNKAPYYPWLDFGGRIDRGGHPTSRPFVEGGRYLYPSWLANRKSILEALAESISDLARESGLEVT